MDNVRHANEEGAAAATERRHANHRGQEHTQSTLSILPVLFAGSLTHLLLAHERCLTIKLTALPLNENYCTCSLVYHQPTHNQSAFEEDVDVSPTAESLHLQPDVLHYRFGSLSSIQQSASSIYMHARHVLSVLAEDGSRVPFFTKLTSLTLPSFSPSSS